MKATFRILSYFLSFIILFSFAGCNESYKDAYIYYELSSIPKTLDPQLVKTDDEATVVRCLYDTLLRYDKDGKLVPSAAESYSKDGLVYTFKLKEDAAWTNGTPVTAYDFQFGFYRAVNPETSAPYSKTLLSIKNADKIISGASPVSDLGVTVVDKHTLKIELVRDDPEFLNTLTTPISMPCNKEFFEKCKATYGLNLDSLLCNGSYYVRIWDVEEFLIRLAKNLEFTGTFEANSMRMYFTCSSSESVKKIEKNNSDLGFISADDFPSVNDAGLKSLKVQSGCYMLTLGSNINPELREALLKSVNVNTYKNNLPVGYQTANNIYPSSLNISSVGSAFDTVAYDINLAAEKYNSVVKNGGANSLVLRYVDSPVCETVAKALAAHWQQYLGAFINIEKVSLDYATALYNSNDAIVILPFSAFGGSYTSYISSLGSTRINANEAQKEILKDFKYLPLFSSNKYIAFNDYIKINENMISYGIPDLALITKNE